MNKEHPVSGLGTDIIEIDRIEKSASEHGGAFLNKILTRGEQDYCAKFKIPFPHYAGRFAAKEAVAKALGVGIGEHLSFRDIEILPDVSGKPIVSLSEKAKEHFGSPTILLSISHCKTYANAVAIRLG